MKPRTFEHFPDTATCPLYGTNRDSTCCLVVIDETGDGKICAAQPIHMSCLLETQKLRFNKEQNLLYRFCE